MAMGNVKWWDNKKGFGFIINEDGKDVFVHHSAIVGAGSGKVPQLKDGQQVEFDLVQGEKGLLAQNVKPL